MKFDEGDSGRWKGRKIFTSWKTIAKWSGNRLSDGKQPVGPGEKVKGFVLVRNIRGFKYSSLERCMDVCVYVLTVVCIHNKKYSMKEEPNIKQ